MLNRAQQRRVEDFIQANYDRLLIEHESPASVATALVAELGFVVTEHNVNGAVEIISRPPLRQPRKFREGRVATRMSRVTATLVLNVYKLMRELDVKPEGNYEAHEQLAKEILAVGTRPGSRDDYSVRATAFDSIRLDGPVGSNGKY